ncbi:hypothetical protein [Chitinibacter sp. GC72]|uniref:hypothetical protein n=1 Tax=Chitinibacter sp. GC72 TaxID=1526917 RepID=UPI0012FA0454|nr:hypothetical protein [Chitinibacter sp. GC72]
MMAYVREEKYHETLQVRLMVSEKTKEETREPWRFVSVEFDSMDRITPKELRELGKWLVAEGKRIGREYKSNGAPKQQPEQGNGHVA